MRIATPKPKYVQVADLLRDAINSSDYPPGSMLPSQPQLAKEFGISQTLVSKAVRVLAREGLVHTTPTGSRVRAVPLMPRYATRRSSSAFREAGGAHGAFEAEVRRFGLTPRVDLSEVGRAECPDEAAGVLKIEPGVDVAIRRRHMFADDHPVLIATSYVPWELAEGTAILEEDTGTGGIYSRLAELGHEPVRFIESVRVRTPWPGEAEFLKISGEQQVLRVRRVAIDAQGVPVEVNIQVLPPQYWELHYEWESD
ncbi:GntR family transcriptional regulator [Nocardiopsis exhalans]|uniref:GntR family transcriptional regulator n=1 Tax=Nocardiopsis exhalans TaxID=163604 RepID=A0ABY5DCE1_9ACTN|nr:GntR family transcriptional regulator [Nocardiopsis exhalans]USY21168.1 GntR family transcriptional regulator [Nocardiopsis exhalans]